MPESERVDLRNDHDLNGLNTFPSPNNKFMKSVVGVSSIFDGPATFFKGILKFVLRPRICVLVLFNLPKMFLINTAIQIFKII
jgi:hypothetical protein